jgi:uncharacterized protein
MSITTTLRQAIVRHPLTTFFVLTYLLSWVSAPFTDGALLPHGPAIAAIIVMGITHDRPGSFWAGLGLTRWRVGWRWYLIAPGVIAAYLLIALIVAQLFGAEIVNTHVLTWTLISALIFELALFGGMWEEPGWSGYALPRLQARFASRRRGLLMASLVMGGMRAIWHLPLVLYGHVTWYDALFFNLALQLILTWLYNRTEGSVPVVMLAHLSSNVLGGGIMDRLFEGPDLETYTWSRVGAAMLVAIILNSRHGWSMGHRPVVAAEAETR